MSRRNLLTGSLGAAALLATGCTGPRADEPSADVEALASPSPAPTAQATAVPVQPGALPQAGKVVAPVRLRISAMGLDARVQAVGIDPRTGDFAVPPSVDSVGWYRFGPGLEATGGSIVIAGHVDSAAQGKGAFFGLRELDAGDQVEVGDRAARVVRFQVVAVEQFRKTKIPLARYFARDGALRLSLITCGGPFDEASRHYRDNIVVTARAV
ncbi:class F sortase [Catellatospora vulcania]|uniref:class F sortase n=1 Tax=Catellatospora vulcania TaxID=1460450 RepID=UPI0012D4B76F|nr:class F sortase [Catellatospora vulcania]